MRRAKNPRRTQIHVSSSLTRDTYAGVAEWHTYLSQQQVFEGSKSPFHSGQRRTDVPRTSFGLRSTSVGAEPTVFAPLRSSLNGRSPLRFGRRKTEVPRTSCDPGRPATPDVVRPPVFAYKPLWQNWQMHLPAKQGPVDPASGVGTRERSEERRVGKECRSRWSPYH